jgi:hypothetical protein
VTFWLPVEIVFVLDYVVSLFLSIGFNASHTCCLAAPYRCPPPPLREIQSKRVPVTIRYSAESGLKPFFLTTAKHIKEAFPDVVIERVILPKVNHIINESNVDTKGGALAGSTFEVLVDGKVVVRTAPGRKSGVHQVNTEMTVFINMQELNGAISRARRRRRPSNTVYGGERGNDDDDTDVEEGGYDTSRLEVMRNKAREINMRNAQLDS